MKNTPDKNRCALFYDIIFCCLALIAVYISITDMTSGCSNSQIYIDNVISVIFVIDYIVRLCLAKNKTIFFKENIFDLIAIIPFSSLFKVFRVLKILKILKLLKFARISAYFVRFYKRVQFFFNVNGFKYVVFTNVFCIIAGGIAIHLVEGMNIFDGIWWSFVTATTVGYGDISPSTPAGRAIAAILMIVGIGLIGSLTSTITAIFFQNHNKSVKKDTKSQILSMLQSQLDNFDNLTDDDIETICQTLHTLHKQ